MMDLAIVGHSPEKECKTEMVTELGLVELRRELLQLRRVNAEFKKALIGINITHTVKRKGGVVFINAHTTQEIYDLLWKIKEMRGQG